MLRLLHTADLHLGARHADLGEAATAQRERQAAAFTAIVDLAIADKVDIVVIAGDLFDSNVQPKRSVERVAAELARLAKVKIRTVIAPGTHDVHDRASVYRAYDLATLAGVDPKGDLITVLTPDRPLAHLKACDAVIVGRPFATKRAPQSPMPEMSAPDGTGATWRIGLLHAAVAIPGRTDGDDVVVTPEEIAKSGLDYLALGHWHSTQQGKAGAVPWAYSGAPEPLALDQEGAGSVIIVELQQRDGARHVTTAERRVGRTKVERLDLDAGSIASQPALIDTLRKRQDPDLILDVRITGVRPDTLDLHVDEVEAALTGAFLRMRLRDRSTPPLTEGALPPTDTIAGAFIRDLEARIERLEASGDTRSAAEAEELRDSLRLGRLLLAGHEVTL